MSSLGSRSITSRASLNSTISKLRQSCFSSGPHSTTTPSLSPAASFMRSTIQPSQISSSRPIGRPRIDSFRSLPPIPHMLTYFQDADAPATRFPKRTWFTFSVDFTATGRTTSISRLISLWHASTSNSRSRMSPRASTLTTSRRMLSKATLRLGWCV